MPSPTPEMDACWLAVLTELQAYVAKQNVISRHLNKGFIKLAAAKRQMENFKSPLVYYEERPRMEAQLVVEVDEETGIMSFKNLVKEGELPESTYWFSSLPSQDLRQSQKSFTKAFEQLVYAAAAIHNLNQNRVTLKRLTGSKK